MLLVRPWPHIRKTKGKKEEIRGEEDERENGVGRQEENRGKVIHQHPPGNLKEERILIHQQRD